MLELAERLDALSDATPVYGLGYARMGDWRPLVLIDAAAAPPEPEIWTPLPWQVLDWWQPTGILRELPDLTVVATRRPLPAFGPEMGALVRARGSHENGTVGARVIRLRDGAWYPGFLTTGHTFPTGPGTIAVKRPQSRFRRAWRELRNRPDDQVGVVVCRESPFGLGVADPSYDFAVIELDGIAQAEWQADEFVPSLSPAHDYEKAQRVRVFAGVSGDVDRATVFGACMKVAECWRDCWVIGPTSALGPGDSGSAVVDWETGETIGMFVGQSALGGEAHHLFAHSVGRLMEARLTDEGVLIERRARRSK
jgi:hypothetical protein